MIVYHDPDEWQSEVKGGTCAFHQANPGKPFAGCSCWSSFGSVRRDPIDVAKIKARKRHNREQEILAEAASILMRRKAQGMAARSGETAQPVRPEGQQPGGEAMRPKGRP